MNRETIVRREKADGSHALPGSAAAGPLARPRSIGARRPLQAWVAICKSSLVARLSPLVTLSVIVLGCSLAAYAWGGKVNLARKYRPGQRMVYQTKIQTRAKIRSNPPGLEAFLPPMPTEMTAWHQATVTVSGIHDDGTVDIENHFDQFEFQSNLVDRVPANLRESTRQAQQEFTKRINGQTLSAHYNSQGQLLGFEGADEIAEQLDAPLREPFREVLKFFLEQVGGSTVYPGHRVKPGEEWERELTYRPFGQYPFTLGGQATLRYSGRTSYHGIKAGMVEFRFGNFLTPSLEGPLKAGPLTQLEARGVELEIRVDGEGAGRVLLALDDGRLLQNRSTVRQTLSARLKGPVGASASPSAPMTLEIETETTFEEDGASQ